MPDPSVKLGFAAGSINLRVVILVAEVTSQTLYSYVSKFYWARGTSFHNSNCEERRRAMTENNNSQTPLTLLSISQAARELKIGKWRIYEMIEKGEIGIIEFQHGRIKVPKTELQRWVQEKIKYGQVTKPQEEGKMSRTSPEFDASLVMKKIIAGGN
jgi:excisionase family DNA binding protein